VTVAPTATVAPTTTTLPVVMLGADGLFAHAEVDRCQTLSADGVVADTNTVIDLESLRILCSETGVLEMNLAGNEPGAVTSAAGKLTFFSGKQGLTNGYAFKPGTEVEVWLASDPIYLRSTVVEADGTWSMTFDGPADVESGEHTIQAEGVAADNEAQAISAGVRVASERDVTLPATGSDNNLVLLALLFIFSSLFAVVRRQSATE